MSKIASSHSRNDSSAIIMFATRLFLKRICEKEGRDARKVIHSKNNLSLPCDNFNAVNYIARETLEEKKSEGWWRRSLCKRE